MTNLQFVAFTPLAIFSKKWGHLVLVLLHTSNKCEKMLMKNKKEKKTSEKLAAWCCTENVEILVNMVKKARTAVRISVMIRLKMDLVEFLEIVYIVRCDDNGLFVNFVTIMKNEKTIAWREESIFLK